MRSFVAAGGCSNGVARSFGQTFNQHAQQGASIPFVAEGIQQGYTTVAYDTLLLLTEEMDTYNPGDNILLGYTPEGYDEERHRQVYEMTCLGDYIHTMSQSGLPTFAVTLPQPLISPAGSLAPEGPVTLVLDRSNPYDYPVGDTTTAVWTASVAGQSKECKPNVIINFYDCAGNNPPVTDIDLNSYQVVTLGYYCWTGSNMRASRYANGVAVPNVMTYTSRYPQGVPDIADALGHLYTWDAATNYNVTADRMQGICPNGWHIPTAQEAAYVMSRFNPTTLMSNDPQIQWIPENGTDEYGFSFRPAGFFNAENDRFEGIRMFGYFWTTESESETIAHACEFGSACGTFESSSALKNNGYSVRCVLDY